MLPEWRKENNVVLTFATYCCRTMLQYLFGQYGAAVESGRSGEVYAKGGEGFIYLPLHHFYYALALLAHYPEVSAEQQAAYLATAEGLQTTLQPWAAAAPMNFQHNVDLIAAGNGAAARRDAHGHGHVRPRDPKARKSRAIRRKKPWRMNAKRHFYLELGRDDLAMLCMTKAWDGYRRWGATGKVRALEQQYKPLLADDGAVSGGTSGNHHRHLVDHHLRDARYVRHYQNHADPLAGSWNCRACWKK